MYRIIEHKHYGGHPTPRLLVSDSGHVEEFARIEEAQARIRKLLARKHCRLEPGECEAPSYSIQAEN